MRNIHVAFFGTPYAAITNATLSIVSALVRRGFRVTYVTSENYATRVRGLGAEVVCCKGWTDPDSERQPIFDDHPRIAVPNMNGVCRMNARILAEVSPFYEENRPDLVIYDLINFAGRIMAHRWNVPGIHITPHVALDRENFSTQVSDDDLRNWLIDQGNKADRFFERYGIVDSNFTFHREALNIYSIPKAFQPYGAATSDDRCFYAGRCAAEQPSSDYWRPSNPDGKPIALIATSMTYACDTDYLNACIAGLSGLHWHVVVSISGRNDAAALDLPPDVELVRNVGTNSILPYAGLLVFQGGNTSAAEAAYHGVPMIAATFGLAELEWCAGTSIVRLGLGIQLKKGELNATTIRAAALQTVEDEEIRRNVTRMSHIVQREPGAEEAVNRIDEYLATRLPGVFFANFNSAHSKLPVGNPRDTELLS